MANDYEVHSFYISVTTIYIYIYIYIDYYLLKLNHILGISFG